MQHIKHNGLYHEIDAWDLSAWKKSLAPNSAGIQEFNRVESTMSRRPQWFGNVYSMAEIDRLVEQGSKQTSKIDSLTKEIEGTLAKLHVAPTSTRRQRRYGSIGDELNLDRLQAGRIDQAFEYRVRDAKRGSQGNAPVVTLISPLGANVTVDAESIAWQGAASMAIAQLLIRSGRSVEMLALDISTYDGKPTLYGIGVRMTKPGQSPNVAKLATILCEAGFFRTYGFAVSMECGSPGMHRTQTQTTSQVPEAYRTMHGRQNAVLIPTARNRVQALEACRSVLEGF